ncbi:MAG TPA: hypothetical protein PKD95_03955 [Candidatus Paceibacterota bacterium]|nr:hypothetical protein [Candidatus Paceibacterota bacterium]
MESTIKNSLYHSLLRIATCVCAFVLVFDSGLWLEATAELSDFTQAHIASVVGVSLGVPPNEYNQLTTRITELETELAAKERLIAVNIRDNGGAGLDYSTFILSIILFILLVLIVLNYALDYRRQRNYLSPYEEYSKTT